MTNQRIPVVGKLNDIKPYVGSSAHTCLISNQTDYDWAVNMKWLGQHYVSGRTFLIVSTDFSGRFKQEIDFLISVGARVSFLNAAVSKAFYNYKNGK